MTAADIHPTAILSPQAKLGKNVRIGAYAIVRGEIELGDNCQVHAHAILGPYVKLGANCEVHPFAVVGSPPQDLSFDPQTPSWVEVGEHTIFREGVTIGRSTQPQGVTRIGAHCFFMNNSHIAHDCSVGDHTIFANGATLGGHVHVGTKVFIGGGTMAHQFIRIGSYAMVSGMLGLRKDVIPFTTIAGEPILHYRLNTVGLRRAGITGEGYRTLAAAFKLLRDRKPLDGLADTQELRYLKDWLAQKSKRGAYGFVRADAGFDED